MVFATHPDDESIGAAALIAYLPRTAVTFVTDGAPRDLQDAVTSGFSTREAYAKERAEEAQHALAVLGLGIKAIRMMGIADQEASLDLVALTHKVLKVIRASHASFILTHSYEGGHPDHDATALAVHAAVRILEREGASLPLVEFACYHRAGGSAQFGHFITRETCWSAAATLSASELKLKQRALLAYKTQQRVISAFPLAVEHYRAAPSYLFTQPPHAGMLYYEQFNWGTDGARWRDKAGEALRQLGLKEPL
jgi:LmbE family N-acetylglucosaminyl deacetylase